MNISLRQLKAFLQVARLQSFTRAAEQLHISQAGLSSMIQDLERQLDSRLFDRTTRTVYLTPAGRQFLAAADQSVDALEGASFAISRMEEHSRQTLSVGTTPIVAASVMPEVCREFAQLCPNVTVRMVDVERSRLQTMVEAGGVDVGFGVFFKPAAGLDRKEIFRCDLVCITPPEPRPSKAISKRPLAWEDLRKVPLLGLPTDNPVQVVVDKYLEKIGRANEVRLTFNTFHTLLEMVEAGFGSAILPSFAVAAARRLNVGVAVLQAPVVPVNYFQINQKGRARAPSEAAFVDCLLKTMNRRCTLEPEPATKKRRQSSS